ncbi:aldose 1-epimerase [Paenibacillus agricola]|uniref:Aldose 1-epimerase n=1 Tax=Paenibacillus agricola TaxID=2716264 RepID=A0ABX0JFK1_9BACL|nr:aldose 1-epimerase [Paenibacillus agricola]NHN34937.1 aldose 1-epimerase [Paenibacillus agricola]
MAEVYQGLFHGEKAFWLETDQYQAAVLPEIGANLIAFRDRRKGYKFLREPSLEDMEAFKEKPRNHGIPVLFPPNRFEDGRFSFNGKKYSFPINEEKTGNHIHGFFYNRAWEVLEYGKNEDESFIVLHQDVNEKHGVFSYFPHTFKFKIKYTLSAQGLSQKVEIQNCGDDPMPCMLAFHTALNAPFSPNSTIEDCLCKITIGERWELDARMLPTGRKQPLGERELSMKHGFVSPFSEPMDNHYTALPQNGKNYIELIDTREKVRLIYDVGTRYKQWMIWNNKAAGGYFCPEPQINLVNAPNVNLPDESKGLIALEPGHMWTETSRFYVEDYNE